MLHVTNGGTVLAELARAFPSEPAIAWEDVLHEGPVPLQEPLSRIREDYLRSLGWQADFTARDQALRTADRVLLWFEDDLYDQLQLMQILSGLAPWIAAELVEIPHGVRAEALPELRLTARRITRKQFDLAAEAWEAFRSSDPSDLPPLIERDELPHLGAAIRRLLEEYPSCDNGLSRVERQALEALRDHGPLTPVELFAANAAKEESIYLGDAVFFRYLANLKPLIEDNAITPLGIEVLEGKRDWLAIKPAGRWIGGVHFEGANPAWRWDGRNTERIRYCP